MSAGANRPQGYGMTAELQAKKDAKHDPELEQQAKDWLAAVAGEPFPAGKFEDALHDGVYLCKVANKIQAASGMGNPIKINQSKMAFKMMENIGNFLSLCEQFGCNKQDLFQTVDLYEAQNMPQVVNGIHAVGRRAQKIIQDPSFPVLGPKESDESRRQFTDDQLREGQGIIGLQMGSNRGASQAGMTPYGLGRQIEKTNLKT